MEVGLIGAPIEGASVEAASIAVGGVERRTLTDAQGSFTLSPLRVGTFNSPTQAFITARKQGFNPQTVTITIFCGAIITVEFGTPSGGVGTLEGTVTNATSGQVMDNVFRSGGRSTAGQSASRATARWGAARPTSAASTSLPAATLAAS